MKRIFTFVLALAAFASLAKADEILIYQGSQIDQINNRNVQLTRYFVVFDLTTLEYVRIGYGGAVPSEYYYSVGQPAAFVYSPIPSGANSTQSYFAYGSSNTSATFSLGFGFYSGDNTQPNLGGSLTGKYPATLSHRNYLHSGDGSTVADVADFDSGVYDLRVGLTQESNASNDDLTAATAIVTEALGKQGFGPE
jgi:hypothetical protein